MGTRDVLMDSGAAWLSAAGGNASAVSEDPSEAALQNKEISIYWTDSCLITLSLCQSTHCMANEYLSLKFECMYNYYIVFYDNIPRTIQSNLNYLQISRVIVQCRASTFLCLGDLGQTLCAPRDVQEARQMWRLPGRPPPLQTRSSAPLPPL